ncbi:MAG: hypothetical protein RIT12_780 [Actinomycetota bacterium]
MLPVHLVTKRLILWLKVRVFRLKTRFIRATRRKIQILAQKIPKPQDIGTGNVNITTSCVYIGFSTQQKTSKNPIKRRKTCTVHSVAMRTPGLWIQGLQTMEAQFAAADSALSADLGFQLLKHRVFRL